MARHPDFRVSDQDRDETVELLRGHLLAGRLDPDEHEERVEEACGAKFGRDLDHALRELSLPAPPASPLPVAPTFVQAPPRDGRPGTSLALGMTGIGVLVITFGFGSILALPLGVMAWILGAQATRQPVEAVGLTGRSTARTGMWLGIVGTLLSALILAGLGILVVA